MTTTQTTTFDSTALTDAIEARDADTIVASYAADAVISVLDRDHPPSAPLTLRGTAQIEAYYRDVCGRNIDHQVSGIVTDGASLAYQQDCRYPDGGRVLCVTVAHLSDGRIVHQTVVQAWDE